MNIELKDVKQTTELCRYCLMCRHVCPVTHVTRNEATSPHGWGILITSIKRGLTDWNVETVDVLYQCADCGLCQAHCVTDQPLPLAIDASRAEVVTQQAAPAVVYELQEMLQKWGNIHEDEQIRENGKAYIRHCIEVAQTLGATNLVGPIYSAVGRTWQATPAERARDEDLLVAQLSELAAYAADHGVVLCIEPLNRFETSFINLVSQAIQIIDRVDSPSCKILLDTFHMNIEERSMGEAIRTTGPRLHHLHTCENDRGVPGTGHIPWGVVAEALREINYNGPVVIESFTAKVKTIARAAAIWRALAPTQDAIAYDGLKFLRNLLTSD